AIETLETICDHIEALTLGTASLGYIKGNARTATLISILVWLWDHDVDIKTVHPKFYESVREIRVVRFECASLLSQALLNMKFSVRGSIRTSNNIIQCTIMIKNLANANACGPTEFVKKWNQQSGQQHKFTAKRVTSLKLLFETAPPGALQSILAHVEEHGWENCCWSDDNLSNKKLYPDHTFSTGSKKNWAGRLRTSAESMLLAVQRAHTVHNMKPSFMRRKFDNTMVETISMRAAFVLSVAAEFTSCTPVPEEQARKDFVDSWAKGSEQIDMELSSVLAEMPEDSGTKLHVTV
ncbi:unnamed protein product, partial [Prorocentrum cordatum]